MKERPAQNLFKQLSPNQIQKYSRVSRNNNILHSKNPANKSRAQRNDDSKSLSPKPFVVSKHPKQKQNSRSASVCSNKQLKTKTNLNYHQLRRMILTIQEIRLNDNYDYLLLRKKFLQICWPHVTANDCNLIAQDEIGMQALKNGKFLIKWCQICFKNPYNTKINRVKPMIELIQNNYFPNTVTNRSQFKRFIQRMKLQHIGDVQKTKRQKPVQNKKRQTRKKSKKYIITIQGENVDNNGQCSSQTNEQDSNLKRSNSQIISNVSVSNQNQRIIQIPQLKQLIQKNFQQQIIEIVQPHLNSINQNQQSKPIFIQIQQSPQKQQKQISDIQKSINKISIISNADINTNQQQYSQTYVISSSSNTKRKNRRKINSPSINTQIQIRTQNVQPSNKLISNIPKKVPLCNTQSHRIKFQQRVNRSPSILRPSKYLKKPLNDIEAIQSKKSKRQSVFDQNKLSQNHSPNFKYQSPVKRKHTLQKIQISTQKNQIFKIPSVQQQQAKLIKFERIQKFMLKHIPNPIIFQFNQIILVGIIEYDFQFKGQFAVIIVVSKGYPVRKELAGVMPLKKRQSPYVFAQIKRQYPDVNCWIENTNNINLRDYWKEQVQFQTQKQRRYSSIN